MFYIIVMVLSLAVAKETDLHAGGHSAPAETVLHASITRLKEKLPLYQGEVVEFYYYQ